MMKTKGRTFPPAFATTIYISLVPRIHDPGGLALVEVLGGTSSS
jgi:hypothetical protein